MHVLPSLLASPQNTVLRRLWLKAMYVPSMRFKGLLQPAATRSRGPPHVDVPACMRPSNEAAVAGRLKGAGFEVGLHRQLRHMHAAVGCREHCKGAQVAARSRVRRLRGGSGGCRVRSHGAGGGGGQGGRSGRLRRAVCGGHGRGGNARFGRPAQRRRGLCGHARDAGQLREGVVEAALLFVCPARACMPKALSMCP